MRTELEQHQRMVLELNRKYEDVSRAHEQERRVSGAITSVRVHVDTEVPWQLCYGPSPTAF